MIKCVRTTNGCLIPIDKISIIGNRVDSAPDGSIVAHIWTNCDADMGFTGHVISESTYNKLLKEIEIL